MLIFCSGPGLIPISLAGYRSKDCFAEPFLSRMKFFPFTSFRVRMTRSEGFRVRMTRSEGLAMTPGRFPRRVPILLSFKGATIFVLFALFLTVEVGKQAALWRR
jgi:hypothetical protein